MAIIDWDLHYDRRATAGFLAHFLHGGVAESLAEYARYAPYPVDLQMRKNPKTGAEHATLYVGLTSVLQVTRKGICSEFTATRISQASTTPSTPRGQTR